MAHDIHCHEFSISLTVVEHRQLTRLVDEIGEVAAARRVGLSYSTLARVRGGQSVRKGTLALVRQALAQMKAQAA